MARKHISRREFLKATAVGGGLLLLPKDVAMGSMLAQTGTLENYPDAEFIGRNCTSGIMNFRVTPSADAAINKQAYEDFLFPIYREVVGEAPAGTYTSTWFETPYGYVYTPSVQVVKNQPNTPETALPQTSQGPGFWAEVTVPYARLIFGKDPISPWYQEIAPHNPRVYYSQVFWIDEIKQTTEGATLYRANELYGSYGDVVYADARAFHRITDEEVAPIHPEVENKRVYADLTFQTITCYENDQEVFFCRTSSGAVYNSDGQIVDNWATPTGEHYPWRKVISIHMAGGGASGLGWDTPGVPWSVIFATGGASIHSTFWHNGFGTPRSHGCLNCTPEDSKWIWRWVNPQVGLDPGDIQVSGQVGTKIEVRN